MDSRYLQSLVDNKDAEGNVVFPPINPRTGDNTYIIEKAIELDSHTHVTLDGCRMVLADGVYEGVFISKGMWYEGVLESDLCDISIVGKNGVVFDGVSTNGLTERTEKELGVPVLRNSFINLRGVKGFRIADLHLTHGRYWGITLHYSSDGVIENIDYDFANDMRNQDGIDLRRGCSNIVIRNITGRCGDDVVALTALNGYGETVYADSTEYPPHAVAGIAPHITDVIIEKIHAACSGGHGIVRLLCHDGNCVKRIQIVDVVDKRLEWDAPPAYSAIRIGDDRYAYHHRASREDMTDITINGLVSHAKTDILVWEGAEAPTIIK